MKAILCLGIMLAAIPALAANDRLAPPPSPPPVTYEVWGFQWNGQRYVKQPTRSLSTTDLKKAADYLTQIDSYAGWTATSNLPSSCFVHTVFHGPAITSARPALIPETPTFSVWAFQLSAGQWVKDETHCWTTSDPLAGLDYAKKVNAVAGWCATTNCPTPVPEAQRYVDGGLVHGSESYYAHSFGVEIGSKTIRIPSLNLTIRLPHQVNSNSDGNAAEDPSIYDNWQANQDAANLQNMLNTQDMINTQNVLNTQNMINNQTMFNNIQDMINTQNMVNTQNMIDAQNAMNAQMNQ